MSVAAISELAPQGPEPDNLAELFDEGELRAIGSAKVDELIDDQQSRADWYVQQEQILEHYFCYLREVNEPWPRSAAVRTPFLNEACNQYTARAAEALENPKGPCTGGLPSGSSLADLGDDAAKCLNYQFLFQADWNEQLDLTHAELPITGQSWMCGDWDAQKDGLHFESAAAEDVVLSYRYRGPIEKCFRISQLTRLTHFELSVMADEGFLLPAAGELRDHKGPPPQGANTLLHQRAQEMQGTKAPPMHGDGLRHLARMHTWMRVQGRMRPVVCWLDIAEKKVLRISKREDLFGNALCHFVPFTFLPNPTSGFHGVGIGQLMLSLVETCDTLLRQIINQGRLSTDAPVLADDRVVLPPGMTAITPGEIHMVRYSGERLADAFFMPPFREPSQVLYQVLALVERYCGRLSTVSDLMSGIAPRGGNTTATESLALLDQGVKVFSSIHRRALRSIKRCIDLACRLNAMYLKDETYSAICGPDTKRARAWAAAQAQWQQAMQIVQGTRRAMSLGEPTPPLQVVAQAVQIAVRPPPKTPYQASDFAQIPGPAVQPSADPQLTSRPERMALARDILQTISATPQAQADPTLMYAPARYLMKQAGGDEALLDEMWPKPEVPPPPPDLGPNQEHAQLLRGQPIFVLPNQDHDHHNAIHAGWLAGGGDADLLAPEGKEALIQHMREHAAARIDKEEAYAAANRPAQTSPGGVVPLPGSADAGAAELAGTGGMAGAEDDPLLPRAPGDLAPADYATPSQEGRFPQLLEM